MNFETWLASAFSPIGRVTVFAALLMVVVGCGGKTPEGQLATVPVKGQIVLDGKPAEGVQVVLAPTDAALQAAKWPSGFPRATVAQDGSCIFTTYTKDDGAPAGAYAVLIQKQVLRDPQNLDDDDEIPTRDLFNGQYSKAQSSPWKVSVQSTATELPKIELKLSQR